MSQNLVHKFMGFNNQHVAYFGVYGEIHSTMSAIGLYIGKYICIHVPSGKSVERENFFVNEVAFDSCLEKWNDDGAFLWVYVDKKKYNPAPEQPTDCPECGNKDLKLIKLTAGVIEAHCTMCKYMDWFDG